MGRLRLTRIMLAAVVAGCQATAASTTPTVGPAEAPNPTSQPTATAALPRPKPVAQPLEIWGELPLTGRYATLSEEIETAFQLAVQADGATVRNWTIRYVSHDDGSAASGTWSADLAIASATGAISDPAVVAYLGPYNSGAAKVAIPVLCTAGIAMVSAGTTYPGLTRPAASGEPEAYYPGCTRNFFRTIQPDNFQADAAIAWIHDHLHLGRVEIVADGSLYGMLLGDAFKADAARAGLTVTGQDAFSSSTDLAALVARIVGRKPTAVYLVSIDPALAANVVRALRAANAQIAVIGADAIDDPSFVEAAGQAGADTYAIIEGTDPSTYKGTGGAFRDAYRAKTGRDPTAGVGIYGYEAADVILEAITASLDGGATDPAAIRAGVLEHLAGLRAHAGALGTWSFDGDGDPTVGWYTILSDAGTAFETVGTVQIGKP